MNKTIEQLEELVSKDTLYDVFIIQNKTFDKTAEYLNITRNDLRRLLTVYKIKKNHKLRAKNNTYKRTEEEIRRIAQKSSETQKKSWSNKSQAEKDAWAQKCREIELKLPQEIKDAKSDKYRTWWYSLTEQERADINTQRSISCKKTNKENPDIQIQRNKSFKKSFKDKMNRLCRTLSEQAIYDVLILKYSDLKYDIKVDERYPFFCDFYIPSQDLFIEFQGHPSHGRLPIQYLDVEEYFNYPIEWQDVFANRDIQKYNYIVQNNLNMIRFYPEATLEENILINGEQHTEVIQLLKSIKLYK